MAQDEKKWFRLYSMSAQINAERGDYYDVLERTQKGDGDITGWLTWFLGCFLRALGHSGLEVEKALGKLRFWQQWVAVGFSERQKKVPIALPAKRDIADLVARGEVVPESRRRQERQLRSARAGPAARNDLKTTVVDEHAIYG